MAETHPAQSRPICIYGRCGSLIVHVYACLLACLWLFTVNFKWVHLNVPQRSNVHMQISSVKSDSVGLLPECNVGVKTTQVEACMATYVWFL